jgi:hypothetical protein
MNPRLIHEKLRMINQIKIVTISYRIKINHFRKAELVQNEIQNEHHDPCWRVNNAGNIHVSPVR